MNFSDLHQEASWKGEDEDKRISSSGLVNVQSQTLSDARKSKHAADTEDPVNAAVKVEANQYSVPIVECIFDGIQNDPQLYHLARTNGTLPSCSFMYGTVEPQAMQVQERVTQDRIQVRTSTSASWSAKSKTLNKPLSCPFCSKSFYRQYHLQVHQRSHTGERPFGCSVCGKRFSHRSNLNKHQRIHTREKPYRCSLCGKICASQNTFESHMTLHGQNDPQLDPLAGTSGTLPSCSIKHVVEPWVKQVQAGTIQEPIQVRTSKQNLATQSAKPQNQNKILSCPFCSKCFYSRYHLQVHQRTHTGEKPFGCAACGKSFAHRSNLNTHQRSYH